MMTGPSSDRVVGFYRGGRDEDGRTLSNILSWDDDRLEAVHDYIQWVFPTRRPSGVNAAAPLVTQSTVEAFASDPALRGGLRRALDRLLAFYGLRRLDAGDAGRIEIDPARFETRRRVWLHPGNHNHLRLTRIMQSLSELGLPEEAGALQRCLLEDVAPGPGAGLVTRRTLEFWRAAV